MAEMPVGAALLRTSLVVAEIYQAIAGELGLSTQQAVILVQVRREPRNMQGLGRRLRIGKSTMTGVIARMLEAGLVEQAADPDDRRRLLVTPTARGAELADELLRRVPAALEELLVPLSGAEQRDLAGLLARVVEADDASDGRLLPSE